MNNELLKLIKHLTKNDTKSLSQKALKAAEEVGELAKWTLPYDNAAGTTHRFVSKRKILEEVADVTLVVMSMAFELGFTYEEIEEMMKEKSLKWDELSIKERKVKYPLPYEMHITVKTNDLEKFKNDCSLLNVKPIILDLQNNSGKTVFHDVMTSSIHIGNNRSAIEDIEDKSSRLRAVGYQVVREKIETVPWHPAAPSNETKNPKMPENCYFECHFGILVNDERIDELRNLSEFMGCHLSRNIFKKIDETNYKIMMTYRSYDEVYETFQEHVKCHEGTLKSKGFEIDKTITEFSIYDTKVSHDSEWLKKNS